LANAAEIRRFVLCSLAGELRFHAKAYRARLSVAATRQDIDELLGEGDSYVNDQLDVTVQDTEVLAEIEMMTNLIIATSEADGPLPQVRIDEILGIQPTVPRARLA
jgi:hypothetical protein